MNELFTRFNGVEIFFLICALIGGLFFVFRLITQFVGMTDDVDADFDAGHGDASHIDADASFKLLTLQGLTAFLMMFGLVGLALYRQSNLSTLISMIGGILAGLASVWVIGKLFAFALTLQSSGTTESTSAVGCEGTVYLTIPAQGTGSVQVNIKNCLREYDAVSHSKEEIMTGEPIRVVWVNGSVLVVEKINRS